MRRDFGLLAEAASQVANVRVRNVATVGGAVAYAEPQTDTPTALTAYGATVRIAGPQGERSAPIEEFYLGPYEPALAPGELVIGVDAPHPGPGAGGSHMKFTVGSPENKPVANASALVTVDPSSGACASARIVMGAAGPVAHRGAGRRRARRRAGPGVARGGGRPPQRRRRPIPSTTSAAPFGTSAE